MTVGLYGPEVLLNGRIPTPVAMASTSVTVRNTDGSAATLYTDATGTTSTGTNVVVTDSRGSLSFYAAPGFYDLAYTDSVGTASLRVQVSSSMFISVEQYASAQAAINAAPVGSTVLFPAGNTAITTALSVTKSLTFRGNSFYGSRIVATGCNGIEVAAGVSDFHMETIEVASSVRYSTTPNTLVGIKVSGTTGARPSNHVYRDVYVDGFKTAFQSCYLWSSVFDNFRCDFGLYGLDIYGLSVNNVVSHSLISVGIVSGSKAVRLAGQESPTDATAVGSEGWLFHDSLMYGGEYGFDIIGNAHIDIHDCIIDFCQVYGVRLRDNGTNFAGNVDIHDNYIAMTGAGGVAAIQSANTVSNAGNTKNRIHGNIVRVYSGSTCSYGINQSGGEGLVNAQGNVLKGFATADIFLQSSDNTIIGNECLSGMSNAIAGIDGQRQLVANNMGDVFLSTVQPWAYVLNGDYRIGYGLAAPTALTWARGDRIVNAQPSVGSAKAWTCTVAGTPGTWVSEGNL